MLGVSPERSVAFEDSRSGIRAARDAGDVLAPATDASQMGQIITNSTVNGTLQAIFALLVIVVVLNAAVTCVRALRAGGGAGVPTTEEPKVESELVDA